MLLIESIQKLIKTENYIFSKHAELERQNDRLEIQEIEQAVLNGIIIEHYPDTGRGESCLVAGFASTGRPVHVVCAEKNERLILVTVYIPVPPKFVSVFERKKL